MANDPAYMMILEQARYANDEGKFVAGAQAVDTLLILALRNFGEGERGQAEKEGSVVQIRAKLERAARDADASTFNAVVEEIEWLIRDAVDREVNQDKVTRFKIGAEALWARYQIQLTNGVLDFTVTGVGDDRGLRAVGSSELSWVHLDMQRTTIANDVPSATEQAAQESVPTWAIGLAVAAGVYFLL